MNNESPGEPAGPKLNAPSYDRAYREFLTDAVDGFIEADPVLGNIKRVRDRHIGPIRNVRTVTPLDQPMKALGATMTLHRDAILSTDVDAHTLMIAAFAEELIAEQTKQFFRNIGEISTAAGTSVENVGQGAPTIEQMRELLSKMDFTFDNEGKISGLQLYVDPSQKEKAEALMREVEQDPECIQIILKKRSEWFKNRAAQSSRTLSR